MTTLWNLVFALALLSSEAGFQPLFNGKDLDGWEVDTPGIWSARDGMIVGKTSALDHNDFLRTRKQFANFELRLSFRLVNGSGNSGVQFRSKPVPGSHEVAGFQADIGQQYWGCLYDESRRNKILVQAPADASANLQRDGWNHYAVTAQGDHIVLELNGIRTVDYVEREPAIDRSGIIALQVHGGPPMEVQFKDIRIRELP
jgi:hypothetical protein